jgi:hypothetical protein
LRRPTGRKTQAGAGANRLWGRILFRGPCALLVSAPRRRIIAAVKETTVWLLVFTVFALTRVPGVMPENFSAAYALMFCAGVFLRGGRAWWLPLAVMLVTDLALNLYYRSLGWAVFQPANLVYLAGNYVAYAALILLGRGFGRFGARATGPAQASWLSRFSCWLALVCGGLLGAVVFYLVTNTLAWLFNPFGNVEYTKTLAGWWHALTRGTAGWPETWTFFRNTLGSGGLFTGLFAAALQVAAALEQPDEEPAEPEAAEESPQPEEAGA